MPEEIPEQSTKPESGLTFRGPLPWQVLLAVLTFVAGTLFSAGMGWGRSKDSLDSLTAAVSRLQGAVEEMGKKSALAELDSARELEKIKGQQGRQDDHLKYDDQRLDRMEASLEEILQPHKR